MKDSLKWIGGGLLGVGVALSGVLGLGYAAGIEIGGHRNAAAVAEPMADPLPPVPSPLHRDELVRTHADPIAAPEPAPAPAPEPAPVSGPIRVRRLVVASDIRDHEPVGASDAFRIGAQQRIYAFVDAVNETNEQVRLRVTFEPEQGMTTGHVGLDIPAHSPRFRTWAYTRNIGAPGHWEAVVRAPDGTVIAHQSFEVVR